MRIALGGVVLGLLAAASSGCQAPGWGRPGYATACGPGTSCAACGGAMAGPPVEPAGVLADHQEGTLHQRRGPQSHLGPAPGPAAGPPAPTVAYPYYTTRGPRDFLASNPPSPGR